MAKENNVAHRTSLTPLHSPTPFCVLRFSMKMEFNQKRKLYNNNELRYCYKGKTYCIRSSSAWRTSERCYLLPKFQVNTPRCWYTTWKSEYVLIFRKRASCIFSKKRITEKINERVKKEIALAIISSLIWKYLT